MNIRSTDSIRLLCFDVDYTLLSDDHQLLPMTEQTIKRLQSQGIKVMLATGKNLSATRDIVERLDLNDPLIFTNGCIIQYRDGKIFSQNGLDPDKANKVIQLGTARGMEMMVSVPDEIFVKEDGPFFRTMEKYGNSNFREIKAWDELGSNLDRVLKIVFIDEDNEKLMDMNDVLENAIPDGIETCHSLPVLLEVLPEGVSKGSALQEVTRFFNYPREAVIAFGDGNNDIEMIEFAGIGVAMENATPGLKKVADVIVPSNNEEGTAQFLKNIFNLH